MTSDAPASRRPRADGTKIKSIRESRLTKDGQPMTQAALAKRARMSARALRYIESGQVQRPHEKTVRAIARTLGVSIYDITIRDRHA